MCICNGGGYLDIKSSINRSLDELLEDSDELILSHWDNQLGGEQEGLWVGHDEYPNIPQGELMQWYILARPRHPMLREVIIRVLMSLDGYNPIHEGGGQGVGLWGTLRTTGPIIYTHTLYDLMPQHQSRFRLLNLNRDWGFVYSIFSKPGESAHKKVLKTDYRKTYAPIVAHPKWWVQKITEAYLKLLQLYARKRELE